MLFRSLLATGLGLSFPLYTGGRLEGQIEEVQAQLRVLESREEELKQRIAFEVRSAWLGLLNARESIPVLQLQVESSRQATRLASARYRERLGAAVELHAAQASLAEAGAAETIGRYAVKIAESGLKFAVGRH